METAQEQTIKTSYIHMFLSELLLHICQMDVTCCVSVNCSLGLLDGLHLRGASVPSFLVDVSFFLAIFVALLMLGVSGASGRV